MSRKKDAERLLAQQQAEARRGSAAHRSLRRRAEKRAAATGGVAGQADAIATDGNPAPESPDAPDRSSASDTSVDAAGQGPKADAVAADTSEAPTDTVTFARVPEFLRETEGSASAVDGTQAPSDIPADADTPVDGDGDTVAVAPTSSADSEVTGVDTSSEATDLAPATESKSLESADAEAESAAEPVGATAPTRATFYVPESDDPPYEPVYSAAEPESSQAETMVLEPVATPDGALPAENEEPVPRATPVDLVLDDNAKKDRRRRWPWVTLIVLLIAALGYYALAVYSGGRISASTKAIGVNVSGQDVTTAAETLNAAAESIEAEPVTLVSGDAEASFVPSDAGLTIDTAAMIDEATGFTLNPITIFTRLTSETVLEPIVVVDDDLMSATLETAAGELDTDAVDASVIITGTTAEAVAGTPSITVDQDSTADRIAQEWPAQTQVEVVTASTDAAVADTEAEQTAATLNDTVLASAVTLTGPNGDVVLEPSQFAEYVSTKPDDTRLQIVADGAALSESLRSADPSLENSATDATLRFDKQHKLVTEESVPGRALDDDLMGAALVDAAMAIDHTGPIAYSEVDPAVSSDDLGVKDLKEVVSSFSTPLTNETIRTKNLVRGAEKVSGVTVLPGEQFDLAASLQPITKEGGFFLAHVIENGILVDGIGGGLSQMATTTYNAGYFAGYKNIAHQPHSKYFERYPAGRESTLYGRQINMIFENNTPYAAVMSSYVKDNRLYVDIWSTPHFTVKTEASPRTNVVQPKTVELDRADCQPNGFGQPGFTITNTRTVFLDGEEVDKNAYTWTYKPGDKIVCL